MAHRRHPADGKACAQSDQRGIGFFLRLLRRVGCFLGADLMPTCG